MQLIPSLFAVATLVSAVSGAPVPVNLTATCSRCHTLDVVRAQRLTREEWEDELRKMTRMGAKIPNRAALLKYLTKTYGPEAPASSKKTFK